MVALLILHSCGRKAYSAYRIGETATTSFTAILNGRVRTQIYADATDDFRRRGLRADRLACLEKVHGTMGNEPSAHRQGFPLHTFNGITYVALRYATTSDKGTADEQFIGQINNCDCQLYGDHIDSPNFRCDCC